MAKTTQRLFFLIFGFLFIISFLSGCKKGESTPLPSPTPSPTPTILPTIQPTETPVLKPTGLSKYALVASQACTLIDQRSIVVQKDQGPLIAWSPAGDQLAYVGPSNDRIVSNGSLYLLSAPRFAEPELIADAVFGDLVWSPDGSKIAYIDLRMGEGLYTIMVVDVQNKQTVDLYPGQQAKTDEYASLKTALKWVNEDTLQTLVSCGIGCQREDSINITNGTRFSAPSITNIYQTLKYPTPVVDPTQIPVTDLDIVGQAQDGDLAYIENNRLWIYTPASKTQFELADIGPQYIYEARWSKSREYIAVRFDDKITIYQLNCSS